MKIYIGGLNAVGKSTLLKKAADQLGFTYVHATSGLLNHLGFGKDYEKLRALSQHERDIALAQYIESLFTENNRGKSILVDGHYLSLVRGKIDQVTGPWIGKFDALALISAPIEDIWRRIEADASMRDRALFPPDTNTSEQKEILANYDVQMHKEFDQLANTYSKPRIEITNHEGKLEDAIEKFVIHIRITPHPPHHSPPSPSSHIP